jgi:UDP-N-acetylmuramoyl-L-alanyl-D-glutamate--2,6-diaminopimelate ligase
MHQIKSVVKKLLPKHIRQPILNQYHLATAVAANIRYGFPTKDVQVIMVTGTNGKTTTATLIAEMLTQAGYNVGLNSTTSYSYGGKVVKKSGSRTLADIFELQRMFAEMKKAGCEYIVLEATSMGLEQHRLWGVPCDVAVMTNLTQDHLDYHGTMERYAAAKARLFKMHPRLIVLNHDDEWFDYFNQFLAKERKVTYGTSQDATVQIAEVALSKDGSDIKLIFDGAHELKVHTHLPGKFNVYNATAAATVGYYLQLEPEQVATGIAALKTVAGRVERVDAGQPFEVVVDYAHTPDALQNVLSTLKLLTKGRLIAVFGATGDRDRTKRPLMGTIAAEQADRIFITDEETYKEDAATIREAILKGVKEAKGASKTTEVPDRREAMRKAFTEAKKGDIVAVTGMGHETARNMGGVKEAWSDPEVAREVLAELGYTKKQ